MRILSDNPDSRREWDRLLEDLSTPDDTQPIAEVDAELRAAGYDPEAFRKQIRDLQSSVNVTSTAECGTTNKVTVACEGVCVAHSPCQDALALLTQVGHEVPTVAKSAINELRRLWRDNKDALVSCFQHLTRVAVEGEPRARIMRFFERDCPLMKVLAYRNFKTSITPNKVISWLRTPQTRLYRFAESSNAWIYAAEVDCEDEEFTAALVQCGHNRFVHLLNRRLIGDDLIETLAHELLTHNFDLILSPQHLGNPKPMEIHSDPAQIVVPFAKAQQGVDQHDKRLVARWIAQDLPLSTGAGVFLDAGSHGMMLWAEIRKQLRSHVYSHLAVRTNSFPVLADWVEENSIQFQGTTVETVGDVFDVAHLAFYGPAAKQRLMEENFRPTVYIGTSGIEFSDESILFGYHQGSLEGDFKQWLFQCPARSRVILATPRKIGNAGGRVFDLLKIDKMDVSAPLYFVTTNPEPGTKAEDAFRVAQNALREERMVNALRQRGIRLTWITVDRESDKVPKALERFTVPKERGVADVQAATRDQQLNQP